MAVTINLNDANSDGVGINFSAYLNDFNTSFERADYGYFSRVSTDYSGNSYATTNVPFALFTGDASAWSFIADSGASGDFTYDPQARLLSGTLDGVSFGHGLTYDASSDSFSHTTQDIGISGLNLSGNGADNAVHALTYDLMSGNTAELETTLNNNDLVINGSTGTDVLQSYAGNDTLTGGAGDDVFVFDNLSGNDVITDLQAGDTINIKWDAVTEYADLIIDYAVDAGNAVISAVGVTDTITVEGFSSGLDETVFV